MTEQADLSEVVKTLQDLARTSGLAERDLLRLRAAVETIGTENARLRQEAGDLREKEAHFRELFNATYDGIFLIDIEEERIIDANEQAMRLVGYTREEIGTLTIADLHPYEVPHFLDFAREVLRQGRWQTHDLTCRAKWG